MSPTAHVTSPAAGWREFDSIPVGITRVTPAHAARDGAYPGLSAQDLERAARFRFPEDRARFVLGRRLLAALIRDHRRLPPQPLDLALTEQGRPYLADDPALAFSISHAGDVVAVALALHARVGIDVESLDRTLKLDPLAERIFNAADLARFRALPPETKHNGFFRAWTGKEAILKAQGIGLFGGVQAISVPMDEDARIAIIDGAEPGAWQLIPLAVPAGYLGAVACDDLRKTIQVREYTF
jgi:4'-phosphopantetheinyl transferase